MEAGDHEDRKQPVENERSPDFAEAHAFPFAFSLNHFNGSPIA